MSVSTVNTLRQRNRAVVLRHVVLSRYTTRAQIAAACEISVASVTNVLNDLMTEGLVQENGTRPSAGGRPVAVLSTRPGGAFLIGADVGERGVAVELFDLGLNRVDREFSSGGIHDEDPGHIAAGLVEAVDRLCERNPVAARKLTGIGLGLPGIVETQADGHRVLYCQSLGWPPVPIQELLTYGDIPIFADNGAKTLASAELCFGAARGTQHAAVTLLGRGIGMGQISSGRILRGSVSSAGEWGHTKVTLGGPRCGCGGHGCLEAYAGANGILRRWRDAGGVFEGSGWHALEGLINSADNGDAVAGRVLDDTVEILGVAMANLVNLMNPQKIVVGGWVGLQMMQRRSAELHRAIDAAVLDQPGGKYALEAAHLGGDAVALGAALLPLEDLIATALPATRVTA